MKNNQVDDKDLLTFNIMSSRRAAEVHPGRTPYRSDISATLRVRRREKSNQRNIYIYIKGSRSKLTAVVTMPSLYVQKNATGVWFVIGCISSPVPVGTPQRGPGPAPATFRGGGAARPPPFLCDLATQNFAGP